ncbi:hypothetical protein EG327_005598 [Venturia inaequalis]|uniref:Uncharacterized protein n=1 Tax=Venturia inaequalis TaxID=5025 RepID=A0A8H3V853_VENIN|nr:hypothetical protein EG327_005598 [Venturia inaequalis]
MPVTVCRQNHGGGWPVHEIPDPEGPTNCQVCNRTGEEGGHYVTIQAGAIITARPIPDRVHQSDNRYAGGPGMCRPCTEAANYRAPPPPPFLGNPEHNEDDIKIKGGGLENGSLWAKTVELWKAIISLERGFAERLIAAALAFGRFSLGNFWVNFGGWKQFVI